MWAKARGRGNDGVSINSQLPPVGYTVAIEYAFYVFFALCLVAMLSGFLSEKLRIEKRQAASEAVDLGVKVIYVGAVVATIAGYVWSFGRS